MKVMFDHQIFGVQRYGGFTKYFVSLARALRALPGMQAQIVAPAHVNAYLGPGDAGHPLTFRLEHPRRGLKYRPKAVAPLFRLAARWGRPDVIHETHYILSGEQLPRGVPVMATCHDMIIERQHDGSAASADAIRHKRQALERAGGIICISENTRQELLQHYPQLQERVSVVHHGVDAVQPPQRVAAELPERYLLFVGVRGGYKNFAALLQAFGASARLREHVHLVCFGGGAFSAEERHQAQQAGVPASRLLQLSGGDGLLAYAYRHAAALVYPSLHEGFGMPLTEAMIQGCPVLCSRASCFPEICQEAAEYFDPLSVDAMRESMERVLDDPARCDELRRLGRQRVTAFTWQRCAAATAVAYTRLRDTSSRKTDS